MAVSVNKTWSKEDKDYVLENAGRMLDQEIADNLGLRTGKVVTLYSVRHIRQRLGIRKKEGRGVCEIRRLSPPIVAMSIVGE